MDRSDAVEARIRDEIEKLSHTFDRITSCQVVVEAPHHKRAEGDRTFEVRIEIHVPGSVIIVDHAPSQHSTLVQAREPEWEKHQELQAAHKDVYICIRDAFLSARRRLEDYARVLRGNVKHHPVGETV